MLLFAKPPFLSLPARGKGVLLFTKPPTLPLPLWGRGMLLAARSLAAAETARLRVLFVAVSRIAPGINR
jgi:hypothetical protein